MKTLILHQNVEDIAGMKAGIDQALARLKAIGFSLEIEYQPTTKQFSGVAFDSDTVGRGAAVNPHEILSIVPPASKYKLACLIYDWDKVLLPKPTNPVMHALTVYGCTSFQVPVNWYSDLTQYPKKTYPEVLAMYFLHELSHALCYLAGEVDKTHFQQQFPEWQSKQPIDYYLYLIERLKPHWSFFGALPSQAASPLTGAGTVSTPAVPPALVQGSVGARVKQLQRDLGELGYFRYALGFTSTFGPITKAALVSFQEDNGLAKDGVFGAKTEAALKAALQKKSQLPDFGLLPLVRRKAKDLIDVCAAKGIPVKIIEGYRSLERQAELYAQGRTTPGAIVTMAKPRESLHNYAVAFDVIPLKGGYNAPRATFDQIGRIAQALGFEWGGAWTGGFVDLPHVEYTLGYSLAHFYNGAIDLSRFN